MPTCAQWLKSGKWGHLWHTRYPKTIVWLQHTQVLHVQRASKGQVGQVWACPDASGRLYGCGKTGQNTDLLRMEYPKNSLYKPDKWAPAPPGDWYTRREVRSGTACSIHAWHVQVYISSHGTHLHVNHAFWFAPSSLTVYILGLGSTCRVSLDSPRARNDADNSLWHARDAKKHVSGWIHLVWILGKATSIPEWVYLHSVNQVQTKC